MISTRVATKDDLHRWFGHVESMQVMVDESDRLLCMGLLQRRPDGRRFVQFDAEEGLPTRLVWPIRRWLRTFQGPLYTCCDTHFPTARRFCLALGFRPTEEWHDGKVVWQWS